MRAASLLSMRYGKTLFETVKEEELLKVEEELGRFIKLLEVSQKLKDILKNPTINNELKYSIIEKLEIKDEQVKFFIKLLIEKRRIEQIEYIYENFRKRIDEKFNRGRGELVLPLEGLHQSKMKITEFIKWVTGFKNVYLEEKIDKDIAGGFIVKIKDKLIDASVKGSIDSYIKRIAEG
ncbi:MAG: ATP synthase F1 subunit delta [Candidatus Hydrogenedentota bacterium]